MKKIIYGSLAFVLLTLIIISCKKEQVVTKSMNQSLTLENSKEKPNIDKFNSEKSNLSELDSLMNKSKNPYNDIGKEFYDSLVSFTNNVKQNSLDSEEVFRLIENHKFNYNIPLNNQEIGCYQSYFQNRPYNLMTMNDFENVLLMSNIESTSKNKLLYSVALLKWIFYFGGLVPQEIGGFDDCLDMCMCRKLAAIFDTGNWVDKTEFILSCGPSTLWMTASCSWDCW
jgi:hypothetical protein